ncbi:MAG: hypothetical protein V3V99_13270 [candidate division Zixibacteria bacterium]
MSRTYKISVYALLIIIIFAANIFAASAKIGRLGLSKEANFTVLSIEADKHVQVAHLSVEAKEGKPFRIVIDCLASRHSLPQKSFQDIPTSIITSIRTSQYSVDPEKVVRIVLDLKAESIYRVESKDNTVRVLISDAGTKTFSQWSSPRATGFIAKAEPDAKMVTPDNKAKKTETKVKTAAKPEIQLAHIQKANKSEKQLAQTEAKNKKIKQKNDSPIDEKPVPLQEKLALAKVDKTKNSPVIKKAKSKPTMVKESKTVAEKPKQANVSISKLTVISPQPLKKAEVKKSSIKTAEIKTASKNTKFNVKQLKGDSVNRALAFAAVPQKNKVPTPGDAPKSKESKSKDVHKKPAQKSEIPEKQTKIAAVKSTDTKTVENPKVTVAQKQQKVEKPKATIASKKPVGNETKAKPVQVKKAEKETVLASLDTGKPTAAKNEPKVEIQANKEKDKKDRSRFRRDAAKSAKYKQTQVVQFPQRMVIKYKGASARDPFATLIDVTKRNLGPADLSRILNIETMNLVGIIDAAPGGKDAALLEDLDGIGYILKTGDKVKNGYVGQINKQTVYFQLNEYGWSRTIVKQLEKEK